MSTTAVHLGEQSHTPWVVADDLSGACELAGVALSAGLDSEIALKPSQVTGGLGVLDLAIRHADGGEALDVARRALDCFDVRYVKIDSLLRGPIPAVLRACRERGDRAVLCPALPVQRRVVVDGVLLVDGVPLRDSGTWRLERTPPPAYVTDVADPQTAVIVELATVRGPESGLDAVAVTTGRELVLCADAETDDDLDRLAAWVVRCGLVPVGSAGLFAALIRSRRFLPSGEDAACRAPQLTGGSGVLVVAGSAAAVIPAQVAAIGADPADVIEVASDGRVDVAPSELSGRLRAGATCVLSWRDGTQPDPRRACSLPGVLASLAAELVADDPRIGLVLTGGQTARSVLGALGVATLKPLHSVHHGALVATADDGRVVSVRPGSFGDRYSLADLVSAVRHQFEGQRT